MRYYLICLNPLCELVQELDSNDENDFQCPECNDIMLPYLKPMVPKILEDIYNNDPSTSFFSGTENSTE